MLKTRMNRIFHHYEGFSTSSAGVLVPEILNILKAANRSARSIIDIGCGIGTFLNIFEKAGAKITGVDGEHVLAGALSWELLFSKKHFVAMDLNAELAKSGGVAIAQTLGHFDVALCLEVAEHLPEGRAADLVSLLCRMSDVIVWSAAIPGQTGENHYNEQYPAYWVKLFEKDGFVFLDPFRKKFWLNNRIEWWYRQNLFLVVRRELQSKFDCEPFVGDIYITKELFEIYVNKYNPVNEFPLPKSISFRRIIADPLRSIFKRVLQACQGLTCLKKQLFKNFK